MTRTSLIQLARQLTRAGQRRRRPLDVKPGVRRLDIREEFCGQKRMPVYRLRKSAYVLNAIVKRTELPLSARWDFGAIPDRTKRGEVLAARDPSASASSDSLASDLASAELPGLVTFRLSLETLPGLEPL